MADPRYVDMMYKISLPEIKFRDHEKPPAVKAGLESIINSGKSAEKILHAVTTLLANLNVRSSISAADTKLFEFVVSVYISERFLGSLASSSDLPQLRAQYEEAVTSFIQTAGAPSAVYKKSDLELLERILQNQGVYMKEMPLLERIFERYTISLVQPSQGA